MPVEMRSFEAACFRPSEVTGSTLMPLFADQERVLVGAVGGAAVFHDAQAPGGDLLGDAVVEDDHAVGDVLFETVAGELIVAPLAGDDGSDAFLLQPAEQAPQLGPQDRLVGQAGEEHFDGVEHDALCP